MGNLSFDHSLALKTFYKTIILMFVVFLASCSQEDRTSLLVEEDIREILPTGKYSAQIFGEVIYDNTRFSELQKKMTQALSEHAEWFTEYKATHELPLPHHPYMGLTMAEYKELIELSKTTRPILNGTGVENFEVIQERNSIRFKSKGQLKFFNNTEIRFRDNTVRINGMVLPYLQDVSETDTNSAFRSAWSGYCWQYTDPPNALQIPKKDYKASNVSIYTFTVARLEKANLSFIIVKGIQYKDGKKVFEFEAPVFL